MCEESTDKVFFTGRILVVPKSVLDFVLAVCLYSTLIEFVKKNPKKGKKLNSLKMNLINKILIKFPWYTYAMLGCIPESKQREQPYVMLDDIKPTIILAASFKPHHLTYAKVILIYVLNN